MKLPKSKKVVTPSLDMIKPPPPRVKDYTNQVIGRLTVLGFVGTVTSRKTAQWLCRCSCGILVIRSNVLLWRAKKNKHVCTCGCKSGQKIIDLTGQRFGHLVAIQPVYFSEEGTKWECRCDCGNIDYVFGKHLRHGKHKSCGCRKHHRYAVEDSYIHQYFSHVKSSAKRRNISFNLNYEEFSTICTADCCTYCSEENNLMVVKTYITGKETKTKHRLMSVDRYDSSKGYTVDNCVPCCNNCQVRKHTTHGDKYIVDTINKGKYLAKKFKHQLADLEKSARKQEKTKIWKTKNKER